MRSMHRIGRNEPQAGSERTGNQRIPVTSKVMSPGGQVGFAHGAHFSLSGGSQRRPNERCPNHLAVNPHRPGHGPHRGTAEVEPHRFGRFLDAQRRTAAPDAAAPPGGCRDSQGSARRHQGRVTSRRAPVYESRSGGWIILTFETPPWLMQSWARSWTCQ